MLKLILIAILVIGLTIGLVYLIDKFIPVKFKPVLIIALWALIAILGYQTFMSIYEPIQFNKEKVVKYAEVVSSLKIIRDAEVTFYEVNGKYTIQKDSLIKFIDSDSIALTETKTIVEKVNKGGGVIIDVEKRVTDTIGFEPVLKYFKDRNYKTMFKVPGVENTEFELEVGEVEKVQGLIVPTFRARTPKKNILKGMNESLVKQELEVIESDQIKGEYVSVGSLDEVTTGGNWPPSYDKRDGAKEE